MDIKTLIVDNQQAFFADLAKVMQVASVKGEAAAGAPFGKGPREALDVVMTLAESYGFQTKIIEDAVGYAQLGDEEEYIGIVGHLDVVPAGTGWSYPPFDLSENNGRLYGRGVLDNKGPIFACLYGMKLLKDAGVSFKKTLRIVFGTDEESGSSDMPLYLAKEKPPVFGFTPDCKYPVVYGERGVVNYEITTAFPPDTFANWQDFTGDQARDHVPDELEVTIEGKTFAVKGVRAPSNAPELGENAILLLVQKLLKDAVLPETVAAYFHWLETAFYHQHHGEGLGLDFEDADSGKLQLTPYQLEKKGDSLVLSLAIRYPVTFTEQAVTMQLDKHLPANSQATVVRRIKGTHFPKNHPLIGELSAAYEAATGLDSTPVTTTGATYARFVPNIVAFGPSFPGQKGIAHNKDEYMDVADLLKNMEIYMHAMMKITN